MKCLFTFWSLLFVSFTLSGVAQSRTVTRDLPEPPRPSWMESDAGLKTVVSLDASSTPLREAFAALTDGQIEALMQQGSVALPDLAFSPEAQGVLQKFPDPPAGTSRKISPPDRSKPGAVLRLAREGDSDTTGVYLLGVNPENGTYCPRSFIFDTQRQYTGLLDTEEMQLPPLEKQGPVIDLLAHRQSQASSNPGYMTLEMALGLLAQESGLNLYAEVFPRWPIPVDQTKGTPEKLLTLSICWGRCNGVYPMQIFPTAP